MFPTLATSALLHAVLGRRSLSQSLEQLGGSLPTGIFSNELVHKRLAEVFSRPGRTNDFRRLRGKLTLVATDLDTAEAAPFGRPGWDHVPISKAVQASSALPGLFPPVEIGEHCYVDGALKKTMHASVALDEGVDLLLCLNPLVPFNTRGFGMGRIADAGLPSVLSQTFRSMIHSRLELGMKHYERAYPRTDIVLIEPDPRDGELYLANTFGYARRREMAEHAYRETRAMLRARGDRLAPRLARHGITIRAGALADPLRSLVTANARQGTAGRLGHTVTSLHGVLDELKLRLRTA
jgi:NTE family protein